MGVTPPPGRRSSVESLIEQMKLSGVFYHSTGNTKLEMRPLKVEGHFIGWLSVVVQHSTVVLTKTEPKAPGPQIMEPSGQCRVKIFIFAKILCFLAALVAFSRGNVIVQPGELEVIVLMHWNARTHESFHPWNSVDGPQLWKSGDLWKNK